MRNQSATRRWLTNIFIVANLATVLFINQPDRLRWSVMRSVGSRSADTAHRCAQAGWAVRRYAHLVGLDNRWQMFGLQSRFNWWYVIRATYSDGDQEVIRILPVPHQSPRTMWQRYVADFREAKFRLNIYQDAVARESYSRYLARRFPHHQGMTVRRIHWQLGYQMILTPQESVRQRQLVDARCRYLDLNVFDVGTDSVAVCRHHDAATTLGPAIHPSGQRERL